MDSNNKKIGRVVKKEVKGKSKKERKKERKKEGKKKTGRGKFSSPVTKTH